MTVSGEEHTTANSSLGLLDVFVSADGSPRHIIVTPSTGAQRSGRLPVAVAQTIATLVTTEDVRLARRLKAGKAVELKVQVAGANSLDTAVPHQTSNLARLLRPYLEPPPDLSRLFRYQRTGVDWLVERTVALLADDMGLGKTAQVLSALRILVHMGEALRILVACPKSLVRTWRLECERWSPELLVGCPEPQGQNATADWHSFYSLHHVAIVNYERLRNVDIAEAASTDVLVADEAHRIRNVGSGISIGMRSVPARRRWAVSGTPIERSADDLATILAFLDPQRFAPDDALLGAEELRTRAAPYTLRRSKASVLSDLPEVLEHRERLELLPQQREVYDKVLREGRSATNALSVIGRLREICDADPTSGASAKIDRLCEIIEQVAAFEEKAIVFSYFLRPLRLLATALDERGFRGRSRLFEGALGAEERAAVLDRFKSDPSMLCLLASTRVASEGLTLTEANHVCFFNQWWNPSSNAQARDRVVRIGQKRLVHVYIFTCEDTIEQRLEEILKRKDETYQRVVERLTIGEKGQDTESLAKALLKNEKI